MCLNLCFRFGTSITDEVGNFSSSNQHVNKSLGSFLSTLLIPMTMYSTSSGKVEEFSDDLLYLPVLCQMSTRGSAEVRL